ncbi:MAG: tRNA pseudouridine(38-40) synthase TruA [Lachnospirales bacterium]
MYNYKMIISYDGGNHNGWQAQGNTKNTIQNVLENSIEVVLGEKVETFASGRTDKGVHAIGQVVNFKIGKKFVIKDFLTNINKELPTSIAVLEVSEAEERFHSRLNVKQKTYVYKVLNNKIHDPLRRNLCLFVDEPLDIELMKRAMTLFVGKHDFIGFSSMKKTKKSTERTMFEASIEEINDEIHFTFTSDGFLYNQIRIMMGCVLAIGQKKMQLNNIETVLLAKDRQLAGITVAPMGLYLKEVQY